MQANANFYIGVIILLRSSSEILGLQCYDCSESNIKGESSNKTSCLQSTTDTSDKLNSGKESDNCPETSYCQTMFTIQDGITTNIKRSCQDPTQDVNKHQTDMPDTDICKVVLDVSGNPTSSTNCFFSCDEDYCNEQTTEKISNCPTDCNVLSGGGYCDYTTGKCVCNTDYYYDYTKSTCLPPNKPKISCHQCTTDINDENNTCLSPQVAHSCPGDEQYCATTRTQIYDSELNVIQTVVSRGCTDKLAAVDECAFTTTYSGSVEYNGYTCYSTCDVDGCNKDSPDGDTNTVALFCVQCDDPSGSGKCNGVTDTSICPSMAKYCKTTVKYLLSDKKDRHYRSENPEYKLASMKRECATNSMTKECRVISEEGKLVYHTCAETCNTDGCNTGWPARPKCIQCSTYGEGGKYDNDGYDECLENPQLAADCEYPYHAYCYVYSEGMIEEKQTSLQGYPRRITRGCSYNHRGNECSTRSVLGKNLQNCNFTCAFDGCNYGNKGTRPLWSFSVLVMSAAIIKRIT